jgi:hypothetical protein
MGLLTVRCFFLLGVSHVNWQGRCFKHCVKYCWRRVSLLPSSQLRSRPTLNLLSGIWAADIEAD